MSDLFVRPFYLQVLSPCADINKFLWMVRIGGSTEKGSHIKEEDYYTPQGEFRVDREGSPVLLNCLMYKMCYYRFGQVYTEQSEACTVGGECAGPCLCIRELQMCWLSNFNTNVQFYITVRVVLVLTLCYS